MIKVIYPLQKPAIKTEAGKEKIFCVVRKRWLIITPEEWVRQNFILYLQSIDFPLSYISVEKKIKLGQVEKRYDIVIFSRDHEPWMVIECKEMRVALSQKTLEQIVFYNSGLQAEYLVVVNGNHCACYGRAENNFTELEALPSFE